MNNLYDIVEVYYFVEKKMTTTILPAAIGREPGTDLNLNTSTGPLINARIPFIAIKSFLAKLKNDNIKYIQKEGYIDIVDILANPPICNKLLYIVPETDSDIVKSCLLICYTLSMSQIVKESIKLFNIYQKASVKPATSRIPNCVRKPFVNTITVHEFNSSNVEVTLPISGYANRRLKEITKDVHELSTVTGVENLSKTRLERLMQKHISDIVQYYSTQLIYSQISLNAGILNKCIQIAKSCCIHLPLARVIHRYFESLWTGNIACDNEKQECFKNILRKMAEQTSAAIFELEHSPKTFLSEVMFEFLETNIISESLVKDSNFTIDNKYVGGVIIIPPTSFAFIKKIIPSILKQGVVKGSKSIYFKPDDIFEKQTDKNRVEILYKDGTNSNRVNPDLIKVDNILIGNAKEKSRTIVELTKAGKDLLKTATESPNNLMGEKTEYEIAHINFEKPAYYIDHMNKVYPIEILPFNNPENSDSQWIMNTEMNYISTVIWAAINKQSHYIESYAPAIENETLGTDKTFQVPHRLFSTRSVTLIKTTLESNDPVFGVFEAIKTLANPLRFSCESVIEAVNITAERASQLVAEHTKYIQSYFKEVSYTCDNHRTLYNRYMNALTTDGKCLDKDAYSKLMRVEYKEFFTLYKNTEITEHGQYGMEFRYLSGCIPWYICGDEINAIRGNKLLASIQNLHHWKEFSEKLKIIKKIFSNTSEIVLNIDDLLEEKKLVDITDSFKKLKDSGFNVCTLNNSIPNAQLQEWHNADWQKEWTITTDKKIENTGKDLIEPLRCIANILYDAFTALFEVGHEYELNYLFIKNNRTLSLWFLISHAILPVLANGKMKLLCRKLREKEKTTITYDIYINMNNESPKDSMLLCNNDDYDDAPYKSYILSHNVARMATLPKYSLLHRMSSIIMLFMYNTPYALEQLVSRGVHTGFSIAYVKAEKALAEDIMVLHPNALDLILGNGEIDNSEMTSDGSTIVSLLCQMKYTQNTMGPIGLLAQCVYPKPLAKNNSVEHDGSVKISSDVITRMYTERYKVISDLAFTFNLENRNIIERYMGDVVDKNMQSYAEQKHVRNEYVPIIAPAIELNNNGIFPVLGLERCTDFSQTDGRSAFHSFFFNQSPHLTKNPYMSGLFSDGVVRFMKDTTMIDKNVPIKTACLPRDENVDITTQFIEDLYNNMIETGLALSPHEKAIFKNYEDQINSKEFVSSIPSLSIPESTQGYSYDHPHLRLGNGILSSQYTVDDEFLKKQLEKKACPGGDIKMDGTPFGFVRRSPFTANRDRQPIMFDALS